MGASKKKPSLPLANVLSGPTSERTDCEASAESRPSDSQNVSLFTCQGYSGEFESSTLIRSRRMGRSPGKPQRDHSSWEGFRARSVFLLVGESAEHEFGIKTDDTRESNRRVGVRNHLRLLMAPPAETHGQNGQHLIDQNAERERPQTSLEPPFPKNTVFFLHLTCPRRRY